MHELYSVASSAQAEREAFQLYTVSPYLHPCKGDPQVWRGRDIEFR